MRLLRFIVSNDMIMRDPECDFSGLFPGRETEVMVEFDFSPEWNNMVKVAAFWSIIGTEYPPQKLVDGETCMIPVEALQRPAFKMQILGRNKHKYIETQKIIVHQSGGKHESSRRIT